MSEETQTEETAPEEEAPVAATPEEETPAAQKPVNIEAVIDGDEYIRRKKSKGLDPLREVILHEGEDDAEKFYIRKLPIKEINEVFQGEWRKRNATDPLDPLSRPIFDALATNDRMFCVAVQKCVVKKDRTPLWNEGNLTLMYGGKESEIFADDLRDLYQAACEENPTLLPNLNPTAMKQLFGWL